MSTPNQFSVEFDYQIEQPQHLFNPSDLQNQNFPNRSQYSSPRFSQLVIEQLFVNKPIPIDIKDFNSQFQVNFDVLMLTSLSTIIISPLHCINRPSDQILD